MLHRKSERQSVLPRLLVDNDVLLKLAHWQLLDCVPECLGTTWAQVAVLDSLRFRTQRKDKKLFRAPAVADALASRLAMAAPMPAPDPTVIETLQGVVGIDAGEVALIGTLCACAEALWMTGDKRALRALTVPSLAVVAGRVRGRVVCLEQVLWHALDTRGVQRLGECITPYRGMDTAVRCIIGSPDIIQESSVREGLASYLRDLEHEAPCLLIDGLGFARNGR